MLQDAGERGDLVLDDFVGLEGCNEILNDTRPDVVAGIHRAYFAAGADAVETNTFGANLPNLADYDIAGPDPRARREGRPDRPGGRRRDGDRGPAAVRARLGRPRHEAAHAGPRVLRPAARRLHRVRPRPARRRQRRAGRRDLPGPAAGQGRGARRSRRAMRAEGRRVPIVTHVTVETTGTMLLGSEIGAALTAIEPLGVDLIGLNCATGPAEMSEHLRTLAKHARDPAVGDAERRPAAAGPARRGVPADARTSWPRRSPGSSATTGCGWSAAAAGRPRRTSAPSPTRSPSVTPARAPPASGAGRQLALRAGAVPRRTPRVLMVGERTNANGSKAFREAMLAQRWEDCVAMAREQTRDGAHLIDLQRRLRRAATAPPTWPSWPAGWPRRPRCRSCSTPPSRRCCAPGWSAWAGARSSTR